MTCTKKEIQAALDAGYTHQKSWGKMIDDKLQLWPAAAVAQLRGLTFAVTHYKGHIDVRPDSYDAANLVLIDLIATVMTEDEYNNHRCGEYEDIDLNTVDDTIDCYINDMTEWYVEIECDDLTKRLHKALETAVD